MSMRAYFFSMMAFLSCCFALMKITGQQSFTWWHVLSPVLLYMGLWLIGFIVSMYQYHKNFKTFKKK